ncbi:MAG: hypothetical protein KC912_21525 [Proteobacteria bacterium]|nr:hypothetical protein [Pseudomonadota bacterium]
MRTALLLALVVGVDAQAADIRVGPDFGDYATLTEAVAAAVAGDRLLLEGFVFSESVVIDKDLTIVGITNRSVTIEPDATGPALHVQQGARVWVGDLTMTGAGTQRAFEVDAGSALRLVDVIGTPGVQWGVAKDGGIGLSEGELVLERSRFTGVARAGRGGLIAARGGSLSVAGSTFGGGGAESLGGCIFAGNTEVDISGATFTDCLVGTGALFTGPTAGGAALAAENSTVSIRSSSFRDTTVVGGSTDVDSKVWVMLSNGTARISGSQWVATSLVQVGGTLEFVDTLMDKSPLVQMSGSNGEVIRSRFCSSAVTWERGDLRNSVFSFATVNASDVTRIPHAHFHGGAVSFSQGGSTANAVVGTGTGTLNGVGSSSGGVFPTATWGTLPLLYAVIDVPGWTAPACTTQGPVSYAYDYDAAVHDAAVAQLSRGLGIDLDGSAPDAGPLGGLFADPEQAEDADGDGYGAHVDCDDSDPAVHPYANEICNGVDDDCDPATVDGVAQDWLTDADGDGFPELGALPVSSCTEVLGATTVSIPDCDDGDAARSPIQPDVCDGIDNDCDGITDPIGTQNWYPDTDGDGLGDVNGSVLNQCVAPQGYVPNNGDCDDGTPGSGRTRVAHDFDGDGQGDQWGPSIEICGTKVGWGPATDCDDSDAGIYSGAVEVCDGLDNDCANGPDDGLSITELYWDEDGDGFGSGESIALCGDANGQQSYIPGDCDEARMDVYPGAEELCDGIDNDCDGAIDEGVAFDHYPDRDGDGFTDARPVFGCPDYAYELTPSTLTDCDDSDVLFSPLAADDQCDRIDQNCDGIADDQPNVLLGRVVLYPDNDGDGHGQITEGVTYCDLLPNFSDKKDDCDDTDASVSPSAVEACDQVDNNCDGQINEGLTFSTIYDDVDGDGLGGVASQWCDLPAGSVSVGGDCHDGDPNVGGPSSWYRDADGDNYGNPDDEVIACFPGEGWLATAGDCNDTAADMSPLGTETCDGRDEDCDLTVDEDLGNAVFFEDLDGDGYGGASVVACAPGVAVVNVGGDCDDNDATFFPGGTEICGDGQDQDCSGADLVCNPTDTDGDGFCGGGCTDGSRPGDCNDGDASINPWAIEGCDAVDEDCDGLVDEHLTTDNDGDGFTAVGSCEGSADDCNDWIVGVFPGATEACNGLDDDCDGIIDEGVRIDADGDGFPGPGCALIGVPEDCDDTDPDVFPGQEEVANNSTDDDCDGTEDEDPTTDDDDGDGYCEGPVCSSPTVLPGDCDDTDPTVNPGPAAIEIIDGIDNDCDGNIDDGATTGLDRDGDGYTIADGDCNDLDSDVHPDATERCNGFDDDCDGYVPAIEIDADGDLLSACEGDCDDTRANVRPGLAEDCNDGLDNNCSGEADEDSDHDADGYTTCAGDCIDLDAKVNPGADEESCNQLDDDCDGTVDEGLDADHDGVIACTVAQLEGGCVPDLVVCDCDDNNRQVAPGLAEICGDGLDNDCDGTVDNDEDLDGDGWRTCQGDCNDGNAFISPGTPETCDGLDNNCNQLVDETFDADQDGWLTCRGDCDDTLDITFPFSEEVCDLADNDCNTVIDDDWPDIDEDGFTECSDVPDCAPADPNIGPGIAEVCGDEIDNDCDGDVDWNDTDCSGDLFPSYCGCSSAPGPSALWLFIPLIALRRRENRRAERPDGVGEREGETSVVSTETVGVLS